MAVVRRHSGWVLICVGVLVGLAVSYLRQPDGVQAARPSLSDLSSRLNEVEADMAEMMVENFDVPVGTVITYAGVTPPEGWMFCDGRSLNRDAYPELFAALGTTFGGDWGTTFNLPDARNRFVRGAPAPASVGIYGGDESHRHVWANYSGSSKKWTSGSGEFIIDWSNGMDTAGTGNYPLARESGGNVSFRTAYGTNLPPYLTLERIIRVQ